MDLRKLKTLIDLVSESNVSELEITEAEGKVGSSRAKAPWCSTTWLRPCRLRWLRPWQHLWLLPQQRPWQPLPRQPSRDMW